jgi:hypothetical protein
MSIPGGRQVTQLIVQFEVIGNSSMSCVTQQEGNTIAGHQVPSLVLSALDKRLIIWSIHEVAYRPDMGGNCLTGCLITVRNFSGADFRGSPR